jgi:hypothetical protein
MEADPTNVACGFADEEADPTNVACGFAMRKPIRQMWHA